MCHPLEGCWAKIARANEQLEALEAQIAATPIDTDAITFAQEFDPDASTIEVTLQGVPKLPLEWALAAGEAMQNLRAALNYLAWELAKWNLARQNLTRDPDRDTQFPIYTKPKTFSGHMVEDLHPDHVALIQTLQPNGTEWLSLFPEDELRTFPFNVLAAQHPLAVLARVTNTDKHRALQLALFAPQTINLGNYEGIACVVNDVEATLNLHLKDRAHWATCHITPTGPEPKVKVDAGFSGEEVVFEGGRMETFKWVSTSLRRIVGRFEPAFEIRFS